MTGKKKRDLSFWVYLGARVMAAVAGIFTIKYMIAYISKPDYGLWGYFRAIAAMMIPLVSASLPAAMMRMYFDYGKEDRAGKARLITTVFWLDLAGAAVLLAGVGLWFAFDPDVTMLAYFALAGTGQVMLAYFNYLNRVRNDFGLFFVNRLIEGVGFMAAIGAVGYLVTTGDVPAFLEDERLLTTIGLYATCLWAINLVNTVYYVFEGSLSLRAKLLPWREIRALLSFSLPLSVTYFLGWTLQSSDAYLLEKLASRTELADYVFAVGIAAFVSIISQSALTDWPRFYYAQMRDDDADRDQRILKRLLLFLWLHVACMLAIRLIARLAYDLLGAEAYLDGLEYIDYLILGNFFFLAGNLFAAGIGYVKKTHLTTLTFLVPGLLNVGLNALLIPSWGARAAALTTLLGYALFAALSWVLGRPHYRFTGIPAIVLVNVVACAVALVPLPGITP